MAILVFMGHSVNRCHRCHQTMEHVIYAASKLTEWGEDLINVISLPIRWKCYMKQVISVRFHYKTDNAVDDATHALLIQEKFGVKIF